MNIGSLASSTALGRGHIAYSMAMGAVIQMTRELSTEWSYRGVRVNCVTPAQVMNPSLTARMPVDHRTKQPYGLLHGGASVALAETLGSIAGNLAVRDPSKHMVVGLEINANHVRPARDGHVHATARAEAIGRTTQVWTIRIVDDAGKLICTARMTAAVIDMARG